MVMGGGQQATKPELQDEIHGSRTGGEEAQVWDRPSLAVALAHKNKCYEVRDYHQSEKQLIQSDGTAR